MWVNDLTHHETEAWRLFNRRLQFDDRQAMISRIGRRDYMDEVPLAPCEWQFDALAPLRTVQEDESVTGRLLRLQVNKTLAVFETLRPSAEG